MAEKAKAKKTFKERAKAFGAKTKKAYAAVNKGLDKFDAWYYKTPAKKTTTTKKRTTKTTAKRSTATRSSYGRSATSRGANVVININYPGTGRRTSSSRRRS